MELKNLLLIIILYMIIKTFKNNKKERFTSLINNSENFPEWDVFDNSTYQDLVTERWKSNPEWHVMETDNLQETLERIFSPEDKERFYKIIIKEHSNMGSIYLKQNNFEKALESYSKILELDSDNIMALNNMGLINIKLNNFENALEYYNEVLHLDPNNIDAHLNMGLINIKLNNFENALEYYNKVLHLDPNNTKVKKIIKQLGFFIENTTDVADTADNLDGNCNNKNKVNLGPYTKFDKKIFDNSNYHNPDISESSYSVIERKTEENDEELKKRMKSFYKLLENEKLKKEELKNKKIIEFPDDFIRKQMRDSLSSSSC